MIKYLKLLIKYYETRETKMRSMRPTGSKKQRAF
jgi:hypothetical protein